MSNVEVPAPVPPSSPDAWYAPGVRDQYTVAPGVVVTVRERAGDPPFAYEARPPAVPRGERETLTRLREFFADATVQPPLTREAAREGVAAGLPGKWARAVDLNEGDRC